MGQSQRNVLVPVLWRKAVCAILSVFDLAKGQRITGLNQYEREHVDRGFSTSTLSQMPSAAMTGLILSASSANLPILLLDIALQNRVGCLKCRWREVLV